VFFIDDLDRCDPAQIIDLLEAVKLFFDLKHVFVFLAVDKEVIDRGIEVKYSEFKFAEGRAAAVGAEYIEKMVQLPLQLFPVGRTQVASFMEALSPSAAGRALAPLHELVSPNPRKIKRILNILAVTQAIAEATPELADLDFAVMARLVLLQVQSSDLYAAVSRQPDLLAILESCYSGEIKVNEPQNFVKFGDRRSAVQAFCKTYYLPESYLAGLFKDAGFAKLDPSLATYLTMLGG